MRGLLSDGAVFGTIWREVNPRSLWLCWALASLIVAIAGPFNTFGAQHVVWRFFYWGALIAFAIIISIFLRYFLRSALFGKPYWQEDMAVSVCLAILIGPCFVAINRFLIWPDAPRAMGLLSVIGSVIVISFCTFAIRRLLQEQVPISPNGGRRDRLLMRVSANSGARLLRISSDNHHIRVITKDGAEHRLLMRLRDAIAEVDLEPRLCVHRSHWVAQSAIVGVTSENGREVVELTSGDMIPIGPKYRANLITAGVITE